MFAQLISIALCVAATTTDALSISSVYARIGNFNLESQGFQGTYITATAYLSGNASYFHKNGQAIPYDSLLGAVFATDDGGGSGGGSGGGGGSQPNILELSGAVSMVCNNYIFNSTGYTGGGAPMFLMVSPPTDDPVPDLLSLFFSSSATPPMVFYHDRISVTLLLKGTQCGGGGGGGGGGGCQAFTSASGMTDATFANHNCFLRFPQAGGDIVIKGDDGSTFSADTSVLSPQPARISVAGINQMVDRINWDISSAANQTSSLPTDYGAPMTSYESYEATTSLIQSSITTTPGSVTGQSGTQCVFNNGTAQFAANACCNQTLLLDQCCTSTTVQVPFQSYSSISISAGSCWYPAALTAIAVDWLQAQTLYETAAAMGSATNPNTLEQSLNNYQQQCWNILNGGNTQDTCTVDSQCTYFRTCQQGTCQTNWLDPSDSIGACFEDLMSPELRTEIALQWGLDPNSQTYVADYTAQLRLRASCTECVGGPDAMPCQSKSEPAVDANGNQYQKFVPANQTCCLLKQQCNWGDPTQTPAECAGTQTVALRGAQFCGMRFAGGFGPYQDITQPAGCRLSQVNDQTTCASVGANWDPQMNQCFRLSAANTTVCLSADPLCSVVLGHVNNGTFNPQNWDNDCASDSCFSLSLTQNQCNNLQQSLNGAGWPFWNTRFNLCEVNPNLGNGGQNGPVAFNQTVCNRVAALGNITLTFHEGRTPVLGQWATSQQCAIGQCSNPHMYQYGTTASQCAQLTECTLSCAVCRSFMIDQNGNSATLCYDPSVTQQSQCQGTWTNSMDNSRSWCQYTLSQAACVAANYTYRACADLSASQTACTSSSRSWEYSAALQCSWSQQDVCPNAQACIATGNCNDYEFGGCPGQPPGSCPTGGCVTPQPMNGGCPNNLQPIQMGCMDSSVTSPSACSARGSAWSWQVKATNQSTCLGHGTRCMSDQPSMGNIQQRSPAVCKTCGGFSEPIYSYQTGEVVASSQRYGSWVTRGMQSVNLYQHTLCMFSLQNVHAAAIRALVNRMLVNAFYAQWMPTIAVLKAFACACESPPGAGGSAPVGCFDATAYPDVACVLSPGSAAGVVCTGPHGSVTWTNTSVQSTVAYNQQFIPPGLLVASTLASSGNVLIAQLNVVKSTLFATSNAGTYTIVQDKDGNVIGEIIFPAQVSGTVNVTYPAQLCIKLAPQIDQDITDFPIPDFATAINVSSTTYIPGPPLYLSDVVLSATQACGTVNASGAYFAILRTTTIRHHDDGSGVTLGWALWGTLLALGILFLIICIAVATYHWSGNGYSSVEMT